jgi:DNA-binding MarR family transcriptional regulator
MVYTSNKLHYKFIQVLKCHDLTSQQYNVLKILRGFGKEPRTIDFIRERMLDKNSDVSRIIDKLYFKKLVDREESKADRRQKDIKITKAGLDLLSKMDESERKVDTLLSNLTEEELVILNSLLDKARG